jgi:hypothetical protein
MYGNIWNSFDRWWIISLFVCLIVAIQTKNMISAVLTSLLLVLLFVFEINKRTPKDNYQRNPTSYYDEGGWIIGPPLVGNWGYNDPEEDRKYTQPVLEPQTLKAQAQHAPIDMTLCEECVNQCRESIGAGLEDMKPEEPREGYCLRKCQLLCT